MSGTNIRLLAVLFCACLGGVEAQEAPPAASATAQEDRQLADEGWPRAFEAEGHEVVLHQPQVDAWEDYHLLKIRAAVVVRKKGFVQSSIGAMKATARTRVNHESRTVLIEARKFDEMAFPGAKPDDARRMEQVVRAALPDEQPMAIALDRLIAAVALGEQKKVREAQVNLDPPPIHYSETPAVLVMFAGKPRLKKVENTTLSYALNTNWDLFLDSATAHYYLLNGDHWLVSRDLLQGEWIAADRLPADMSRLPKDENWKDVRAAIPAKKVYGQPARVFVSSKPAELIITQGPPQLEGIAGTHLMMVGNTDADLFRHSMEQQYYYLTAGRWFRAKSLGGPWTAATRDLPADFAAIPEDSPPGEVLASVPGTPQAQEAVIQASIPQRATVNRKEVTLTVTYQGPPRFELIATTTVQYAVNSPNSVFLDEGRYYCCQQGVWFEAAAPTGPWLVATSVPAAIYTIPPSHPAHNVTYVYVYESTPETVVVGTTAGYSGQYISSGLVFFGAGVITGALLEDDDDDDWCYWYPPYYFSYGCGAYYSYYNGTYFSGARACYGPYGGAGAWAGYNPATGVYSRGAYRHGPAGSAYARQAYNPWSGNYAARAGGSNAYGSWGRGVVSDGDNWASGGHASGARGSVAGIRTSEGTGIAAGRTNRGPGTAVAKDKEGDLYVARNGNVYKRDDDGRWHSRDDGNWKPAQDLPNAPRPRPNTEAPAGLRSFDPSGGSAFRDSPPRPAVREVSPPSGPRGNFTAPSRDLNTQAFSRDRGSYSAGRATQRSSGASGSRSRSGGGGRR